MTLCYYCQTEKPDTSEFWPTVHGQLRLSRCRKCCSKASSASRRKNPIAANASNKAWKLRNKEQNAEINKIWSDANREKVRAAGLKWAKDHPDRHNAKYAKRRAAKLQRTPIWLTKDELSLIEAKYAIARWLRETTHLAYHVDHIIPLQGEFVSGLHVPNNLTVIYGISNLSKGNKYEVS